MRGDDGFEDREGHQAPFTLPEKENSQRPTPKAFGVERWELKDLGKLDAASPVKRNASNAAAGLFRLLNRLNHFVEIRPLAGLEFGMEQFSIGANFEGAAARWNQRKRLDALAELENFGRQTDGLRRVVSNDAVFD